MGTTPSKGPGSGKVPTGPKLLNLGVQTPPLTSLEHLAAEYAHYLTPSLTSLNVSHNSLTSLPASLFGHIPNLELLDVSGNMLSESLPVTLPSLKQLRELYLGMNRFQTIPEPVFYLSTSLAALELPSNELTEIPERISLLVNLVRLDICSNNLTSLPEELGCLTSLVYLRARANKIESIPTSLGKLHNLSTMDLRQNELEVFPGEALSQSGTLEKLLLTDNHLRSLPEELSHCTGLCELDVGGNKLTAIPSVSGFLALKRLMLNDNRLVDIPPLEDMNMLRELDLRNNHLTSLDFLHGCPSLQMLSVRDNDLTIIPKTISSCKNLEEFDASVNHIEEVPDEMAQLTSLCRLYLSDNHISDIPRCWTQLTRLRLLGLAFNDLDDESFDESFWSGMKGLVELRLLGNKFTGLPPGFGSLERLERFYIGYNEFEAATGENPGTDSEEEEYPLSQLELTQLEFSGNRQLTRLPNSVLQTKSLRKLWLGDCGLKSLPKGISALQNLEVLDLSCNNLSKLPKALCSLPNLIEFSVPHNDLAKLPSDFDKLSSLQLLDVSWNPRLSKFPSGIARISGLLQVKALYCSIDELPEPWMSFTGYPPAPPPLAGLLLASERPPPPTGLQLKWVALEGNPIDGYTLPPYLKYRVDQELRGVVPRSRPRLMDAHPKKGRPKSFDEPSNPATIPVVAASVNQRLTPTPADQKVIYDLNISEMQGVRPTMEDSFLVQEHRGIVIGEHVFQLLAIFDGHADAACAEFCATHMHDIIQSELSYALQPKDTSTSKVALLYKSEKSGGQTERGESSSFSSATPLRKSQSSKIPRPNKRHGATSVEHDYFISCVKHGLRNAFKRMNDCIDEYDIQSGCTVAMTLICGNDAWLISCGDARVTLSVGDKAMRATIDHKATDRDERHRIQALGGYITDTGRIMGMIAVSRSLGDRAFRPYVAYTPSIKWMRLSEETKFAIIACDGVWDVMSDDFAVKIVKDFYNKHGTYEGAALFLRESAYVLGSGDNISTMVFGIKALPEQTDDSTLKQLHSSNLALSSDSTLSFSNGSISDRGATRRDGVGSAGKSSTGPIESTTSSIDDSASASLSGTSTLASSSVISPSLENEDGQPKKKSKKKKVTEE
jgi:leucine-rich repeat protein SHOC2